MQVRKFEAPTMADALKIIKQELGPDAIILSTKNNKKGFGLLSRASVEVTAAISEKSLVKKQITERVVPATTKDQIRNLPASKQAKIYDDFAGHYTDKAAKIKARNNEKNQKNSDRYIDILDDDVGESTQTQGKTSTQVTNNYGRNAKPTDSMGGSAQDLAKAESYAQQMRTRLEEAYETSAVAGNTQGSGMEDLQNDVRRLKLMIEELKSEHTAAIDGKAVENGSEELSAEFRNLLLSGMDRKYAASLMKQAAFRLPREDLRNPERIMEAIATEMMTNIKVENLLSFTPGGEQRVVALVGPTGVGKTTTIAKIASQAILNRNLRVGFINLDTYRVGASDQLATYAKILNVPFRHATNEQELERAMSEFKPLDLILVDTTGRSQKDAESLGSMKNLLTSVKSLQTVLIMSATTRDQELYDVLNRFRIFTPSSLVFSKLDEASVYGCIYNVAVKTGISLAYFTVGQRVPEDIESATQERVVDLILDL